MLFRSWSLLLCFMLCMSLLPTAAFAAGYIEGGISGTTGTGTQSDPVICDNYSELKQALEYDGDLYIKVDSFSYLTGLDYHPLTLGTDYTVDSTAINIKSGTTKHLEINTNIKIKASTIKSLLSNFITVSGTLYLSGSGKLSVDFNSSGYQNAVFFIASPGKLVVDGNVTVDGSTLANGFGRAIYNYSGTLEIKGGTFTGVSYDFTTAANNAEAVRHYGDLCS